MSDKIVKKPVNDGGIIIGIHKVPVKKLETWLKAQQKAGKALSSQALSDLLFVIFRLNKMKGK